MSFMHDPDARRQFWCGAQGLDGTTGVVVEFGADFAAGMMEWGVLVEIGGTCHTVTAFPNEPAWAAIGRFPRVHDRVVFTRSGGFDPVLVTTVAQQ